MNNSPTEGGSTAPATDVTTGQAAAPTTSAESSQEAISHEQSQGTASPNTATQTNTNNENSGGQNDDDGLANFAKSQGFDPENLSDDVRRALKIAHDNQKAYRSSTNTPKVSDAAKELNTPAEGATEDEKFRAEFHQFKYDQMTDKFWSDEGRDKSLEPHMIEILNEKKAEHGKDYARVLSQDLNTLYALAQIKSGAVTGSQVDAEAIRREERESIKNKAAATEGGQHATTQTNSGPTKIDRAWLESTYDPKNLEHRKMVDAAVANGDLV